MDIDPVAVIAAQEADIRGVIEALDGASAASAGLDRDDFVVLLHLIDETRETLAAEQAKVAEAYDEGYQAGASGACPPALADQPEQD